MLDLMKIARTEHDGGDLLGLLESVFELENVGAASVGPGHRR